MTISSVDKIEEDPGRKLAPVILSNVIKGALVCNECQSLMTPFGGVMSTLAGYISPPGHNHNDNCQTRHYICPNGHTRKISKRNKCPSCEWVGNDSCFCHDGLKVDEWPETP
jgi:hypothetical protein